MKKVRVKNTLLAVVAFVAVIGAGLVMRAVIAADRPDFRALVAPGGSSSIPDRPPLPADEPGGETSRELASSEWGPVLNSLQRLHNQPYEADYVLLEELACRCEDAFILRRRGSQRVESPRRAEWTDIDVTNFPLDTTTMYDGELYLEGKLWGRPGAGGEPLASDFPLRIPSHASIDRIAQNGQTELEDSPLGGTTFTRYSLEIAGVVAQSVVAERLRAARGMGVRDPSLIRVRTGRVALFLTESVLVRQVVRLDVDVPSGALEDPARGAGDVSYSLWLLIDSLPGPESVVVPRP